MTENWTDYCDGATAYAETEDEQTVITFVEPLHFHRERTGNELENLGVHRTLWMQALTTELRRHSDRNFALAHNLSVEWDDGGDALRIEIYNFAEVNDIDNEILWPLFASIMNISDPGTFGAQYVYGNV